MCGVVGIFDSRGRAPVAESLLAAMRDRLVHRGPDGAGIHLAPGIGLGHRRLSIIDLSGGGQPLFNEDGSVVVVFNGEIYNFQALAGELEANGHVLRSRSDTEVIVHAWEQWGPDCVQRFDGMFAFALWDEGKETLFLARDRLGKKPLYTAELADGRFLFASELKALLACPDVARDIDPAAIEDYLCFGYVPDPRSIYRGVAKLPPAHRLVWRRGGSPRADCWWRPRLQPERLVMGLDDAADELLGLFRDAVAKRLVADVPLGAFLSGGVDSSGVVALMAGLAQKPVETFCVSFAERGFDESAHARAVAERYGTRHNVRSAAADDLGPLDRLADMFDEPFGDNSALPTWRVSAHARERVTVALSGDGGDEALAGYRRYRWHLGEERVRGLLPLGLRRPLFGLLARAYPKLDRAPRWLRARTTFTELADDAAGAYCNGVSVISEGLRSRLYSPSFRRCLQGYRAVETLRSHWREADTDDPLRQAQYVDLKTWLAGGILVKVDRASMAASLEVRAPLLDHRLVEWGMQLPANLKVGRMQGKLALKRALEPYVPADLLYRPKQGFTQPLDSWFRGPLAGRMAAAAKRLARSGMFDGRCLARLVDQHRAGTRDHGAALWSLLMLDGFLQGGAGPASSG